MSQRDLPGSVWNRKNEFWYRSGNGEIILYTNTDDSYVYLWKFLIDGKVIKLLDHGLLNCFPEDDGDA
jgi:hypothetical protein